MSWIFGKRLAGRVWERIDRMRKALAYSPRISPTLIRACHGADDGAQIDLAASVYRADASESPPSGARLVAVRKAIDRLPGRSRLVFLMSQVNGLDFDEISRELRISRRAVRRAMVVAVSAIDRAYWEGD